jgi:TonB-linked SusC/RagA family outer membrane protein
MNLNKNTIHLKRFGLSKQLIIRRLIITLLVILFCGGISFGNVLDNSRYKIKIKYARHFSSTPIRSDRKIHAPIRIQGTVTNENGQVIPGVTVKIKNTNTFAITNADGKYAINVPDDKAVLIYTFIGYSTQEVTVAGRIVVNVTLKNAVSDLGEVVVTPLNIQRSGRSLGYAQQSVSVDEMTEARSQNLTDLLAGKVSGINVTTSGQPTGSARVVLRGPSSLTGNNQPLWVVDGVPIDNSMGQAEVTDFATLQSAVPTAQTLDYGNGAADLNPDDIESITVLKGANAAALYGSRAANGAILITTKKGKKTQKGMGISINSNYQQSRVYEFLDVQNVYGEGNAYSRGGTNNLDPNTRLLAEGLQSRSWGVPMLGQPWQDYSGRPLTYLPQPNNIKELYQSPFNAVQNISLSQGDPTYAYRLSYTFTNGNDVVENQNLRDKHNFQLTASKTINKLKLETRLQFINDNVTNRTPTGLSTQSPMSAYVFMTRSLTLPSLTPWKDANGNAFNYGYSSFENPYWAINENHNENHNSRIIGGVTATYQLLKGLQFRGQIAADIAANTGFTFFQKGGLITKNGSYSDFTQNNKNWNSEGLFIYNKNFKNFSISGNLGANIVTQRNYTTNTQANSLAVHDVMSLANAAGIPLSTETYANSQTQSVYGLVTFGYRNYLFLDVTGRNDWSSTLPKANRSFFYPSFSGSFVFSDFFKIPERIMSFGKLRASVARVGNATNPYNLISAFNYGGNINGNPYVVFDTRLKTNELKPEEKTSTELGLEARFLKSRITLDATVYHSSNKNQIFFAQSAPEIGFQSTVINAGEIQNKGLELTLTGMPLKTKNFTWNLVINYAKNINKVISLAPGINRFVMATYSSGFSLNAEVGQPLGTMRGNVPYQDANGNVIVRANGQPYPDLDVRSGSYQPKALGSFGSNFKFKNFDLSFLINARIGGQIYSVTQVRQQVAGNSVLTLNGRQEDLFATQILGETGNELLGITTIGNLPYPDASRAKGLTFNGYYAQLDGAGNPVLDANGRMVAGPKANAWVNAQQYYQYDNMRYFLYDATFVKLNQVILGYNLPKNLLNKLGLQATRISFVGRNIWTIYKKTPKGIDPESAATSGNNQGIEIGSSLPYTSYGMDIKVSF